MWVQFRWAKGLIQKVYFVPILAIFNPIWFSSVASKAGCKPISRRTDVHFFLGRRSRHFQRASSVSAPPSHVSRQSKWQCMLVWACLRPRRLVSREKTPRGAPRTSATQSRRFIEPLSRQCTECVRCSMPGVAYVGDCVNERVNDVKTRFDAENWGCTDRGFLTVPALYPVSLRVLKLDRHRQ